MKKKKGLKILLIVVIALAVLMGCGFGYLYFNGMSGIARNTEPMEGQVKVACVGDSITYGHGITNWPKNNYPVLLGELLGEDYHVASFGVSGRAVQNDSDQPYRALEHYKKSLDYDADILVFMMGSNDSKPENWHGEEAFKKEVEELLNSYLVGNEDLKIYLCTPATAYFVDGYTENVTSHDIQPAVVNIIANVIEEIAWQRGYTLIDIHELTANNPQWFEKDGVHPSNDGAAAIAKAVYDAITAG